MDRLERFENWAESHRENGFEVLRIGVGALLFARGIWWGGHLDGLVSLVGSATFDVPGVAIAHFVTIAHLVGGLLLMAGLITRVAAGLQLPILAGAVFVEWVRAAETGHRTDLQLAVLVLLVLALVTLYGGGHWSADHVLTQKALRLEGSRHLPT